MVGARSCGFVRHAVELTEERNEPQKSIGNWCSMVRQNTHQKEKYRIVVSSRTAMSQKTKLCEECKPFWIEGFQLTKICKFLEELKLLPKRAKPVSLWSRTKHQDKAKNSHGIRKTLFYFLKEMGVALSDQSLLTSISTQMTLFSSWLLEESAVSETTLMRLPVKLFHIIFQTFATKECIFQDIWETLWSWKTVTISHARVW